MVQTFKVCTSADPHFHVRTKYAFNLSEVQLKSILMSNIYTKIVKWPHNCLLMID